MKKIILLGLVALFIGVNTSTAQDAKAKGILDELSKKAKTYTSMKAEFDYIMKNDAEDIDEKQVGSLMVKGDMYFVNIAGQKIISDGKTVWTVLDDAEEVQINAVPEEDEEADDFVSPTKILTLWERGFKFKFDKTTTLNGVAVDVINLYPENVDDKNFHTIKLYVNKSKMEVDKIEIKGKDGTDFIYLIKSFKVNEAIPVSKFTFSTAKNSTYDVIDLR